MILGLLIAFSITFVVTIAVGLVLMIAYRETQFHMYSSYSVNLPPRRFRSYLEREESEIEEQARAAQGKASKPRHVHYHK